jgi:protein-L-isoaspartate(D-aspartate) O-methyltransferase
MTNDQLVSSIKKSGELNSREIEQAMSLTDRRHFVPEEIHSRAYEDTPLPIGFAQTISQPTTVAIMLEMLGVRMGDHVLDIGAGSGWTTAILSRIAGSDGEVIGVERIPELVELGNQNLKNAGISQVSILLANSTLGHRRRAPYNRILVSAAGPSVPPELVDQLVDGGVMVIPVLNCLIKIVKEGDSYKSSERCGFAFVKLIT